MDLIATYRQNGVPRAQRLDAVALEKGFRDYGFDDVRRARALRNLDMGVPVFIGPAVVRRVRPMRPVVRTVDVPLALEFKPAS